MGRVKLKNTKRAEQKRFQVRLDESVAKAFAAYLKEYEISLQNFLENFIEEVLKNAKKYKTELVKVYDLNELKAKNKELDKIKENEYLVVFDLDNQVIKAVQLDTQKQFNKDEFQDLIEEESYLLDLFCEMGV